MTSKKIIKMFQEFDKIDNNPKIRILADKSHRRLSIITPEELLRPFTI